MKWTVIVLLLVGCTSGSITHLGADVCGVGDCLDGSSQADGPSEPEGDTADVAPDADFEELADGLDVGPGPEDTFDTLDTADLAPETTPDSSWDIPQEVVESLEPFVGNLTVEHNGELEPWAVVLRLTFTHPGLSADKFIEKTRQTDLDLVSLFGATEPPASTVLLHVGPGCDGGHAHAYMLVHGAGSHAQQSWINPPDLLMAEGHGKTWMDQGHCVLAVTFPHPFGDNFNWAIELAAAIQAMRDGVWLGPEIEDAGIKEFTLVAHSKGGVAAVSWLSALAHGERGLEPPEPGLIGRLVLLGVPLGGSDWSFRHPAFNYPADLLSLAMPSVWDEILEWGIWKDIWDDSIYGGAYTGVLQLTAAWDDVHSLAAWEQDWYTTYYGGTGFVSHSQGISKAMELSGFFMDSFGAHATPVALPVRIASGGNSMISGIAWESTGSSDGLVFRASAETYDSIGQVESAHHFPLANHLDLLHRGTVFDWMNESL